MRQNIFTIILISLCLGASALVFGQGTGGLKPTYVVGDLAAIGDKKFTVTTKAGPVDVMLADKTDFKRASAENLSLTTATPGAMTDISVGDKLTISGFPAADGKSVTARTVYFIAKSDIAAKNAKESAEWSKRGISGKVTAVNEQTNQIDVEIRSLTGSTKLKLTPKTDAKYLRYAPDSEKFSEAKDSRLTEIKAGDSIRALGDKSSDGLAFTAEKVLTGAFQTVAGTVVSIDPAKNEVVIKNLQTKKEVTVEVTDASLLKKYPAEMAERMAGFQSGTGGARPVGQGGGARPAGPPAGDGQNNGGQGGRGGFGGARPGGPGGAGGGNIDEMLEKFPTIKPADLKVGDMIAVSSTKNATVDRIRAIKLLAGVEPFLRMAQAGNGRGRGGQGGGEEGFSIPGLDGIGFP